MSAPSSEENAETGEERNSTGDVFPGNARPYIIPVTVNGPPGGGGMWIDEAEVQRRRQRFLLMLLFFLLFSFSFDDPSEYQSVTQTQRERLRQQEHLKRENEFTNGQTDFIKTLIQNEKKDFLKTNVVYPQNISGTLYGHWEWTEVGKRYGVSCRV